MPSCRWILPRPIYQLKIYPNQNGVIIKLTYRNFCVKQMESTGPQFNKWHTWTANGVTFRSPFYYFKTVLSLSVLCHDEGPSPGSVRNTNVQWKVNIWRSSNTRATHRLIHSGCTAMNQISCRNWWKSPGGSTKNNWLLRPRLSQNCFSPMWVGIGTLKNIIGLKDNEGETIFTPSAQAELLKNFYSSIFREDYARPTPPLPVPTVVMPVPQFSIPVVHRELSSLDISKGGGPDDIHPLMVRRLADFFGWALV